MGPKLATRWWSPPAAPVGSGLCRLTDLPIAENSQSVGQPAQRPQGARDVDVVACLVEQRLYPVERVRRRASLLKRGWGSSNRSARGS
jgi:hypothetical protein